MKKKVRLINIAEFIVNKRKAFYLIYGILLIFCLFSSGFVKVDNELTDYLNKSTETRRGIDIMNREFTTYATADIVLDNITYQSADELRNRLEKIDGVKLIDFDNTPEHYVDATALLSVTFAGDNMAPICEEALAKIQEETAGYDVHISWELGNATAKRLAYEVRNVMIVSCIIILSILLFTSRTYMEIPVLVMVFLSAAILNKGTNFLFGTISFVSDSVAVVLQLALAIDYAIILCHRYTEERERHDAHDAVIRALCKSIPEISGSCLTTLSGLAAMGFMNFKIGFDLSRVLIKAIIISILTVFTLMPGLLYSFSNLIDKTHHKSFVPKITPWCNAVIKTRKVVPVIFILITFAGFFLSNKCPYAYGLTDLTTFKVNEAQIQRARIKETFVTKNTVAVLVPSGRYDKEQALLCELEKDKRVESVTGLAFADALDGKRVGDKLTPREFANITDLDVEKVRILYAVYAAENDSIGKIAGGIDNYKIPLIDMFDFIYDITGDGYVELDSETQDKLEDIHKELSDGKKQLLGDKHTRLIVTLNLPEESEETYAFLETIRETAAKYYGNDVILAGNSTNCRDLADAFVKDNVIISVLSALFVLIVLFFTFQSAGLPVMLIMVIQGSIWINFSISTILQSRIFFMSYLVVSSIQMGANIDYAIVITSRYQELRREMNKFDAVKQAIEMAFPTVFTSGMILSAAGWIIGFLSSDPSIASIGIALGRGTLISIFLVMGVLPQILLLGDKIIDKTAFDMRKIRTGVKKYAEK